MTAVLALLGPTNTGKTHRAIERMLEHPSGMIGLPLRLLAREVYDRVTARVGEARVALVTGEEQRIPARPSYWIATVEAMPIEKEVDFLAVDEIQLAAHDQRGHVFTSRLLSARGLAETWFLGADTMRGVLSEIVPVAKHIEHPRLSRLTHAGATPLGRLPPRSAVVAFSMPHVYELADKIRARRGGAAVVLGALSPRTRNAQVAMFQAGEVDWLVATDAIGMGLNLDVEHVAFAATRKFDGRDVREVEDAELAQIAGRAGRWIQDGTFGTLTPLSLSVSTIHAIETHAFPRVRRVQWRNDDLDFDSLAALRASLAEAPTRKVFRHASHAEDAEALAHLVTRPSIVQRATSPERVRLLWDVCTIPDFRKLLLEVHVDLLERLYLELVAHGRARDAWIADHVRELDDTNGDVETLVARIASVRTWTYVANRGSWLESPREWQETTRALEDRLSDALHERLVTRFVDAKKGRKTSRARSRTDSSQRLVDELDFVVPDPKHPFAQLAKMRSDLSAVARSATPTRGAPAWVEEVVDAKHEAFVLDRDGAIVFDADKRTLGRIVRGGSIALPDVRLDDAAGELGAGAKSRVQRRLLAFARDVVRDLLGGAMEHATSAPMRGLVHRLEQGLGTVLARDVADITLDDEGRSALERAGIRFGIGVVYLPGGLRPASMVARLALTATWFAAGRALRPPSGGAVSFAPSRGLDRRAYTAIGFPIFGPRAVRADVIERVLARVAAGEDDPKQLASWLGCPTRDVKKIVDAAR